MPTSDIATHPPMITELRAALARIGALDIVDCGVGAGFVGRSLRHAALSPIRLHGLEAFAPYIEPGEIRDRLDASVGSAPRFYDSIDIVDFTAWIPKQETKSVDALIFGDSLEHVEPEVARRLLAESQRVVREMVIVNAPIIHYPQGEVMGNPFEIHRLHWSRSEWESAGGRYLGGNHIVGCFRFDAH